MVLTKIGMFFIPLGSYKRDFNALQLTVLLNTLGSLSKLRRQRQRERPQTKGLAKQ